MLLLQNSRVKMYKWSSVDLDPWDA